VGWAARQRGVSRVGFSALRTQYTTQRLLSIAITAWVATWFHLVQHPESPKSLCAGGPYGLTANACWN
jgi:hypothetical protein